jgi:peptidoglycan hydrolase-like protein with peptidoglycan-binding domain
MGLNMRIGLYGAVAVSLLTAACGTDTTQRAASGGLAGGAIGALAGGPIGAIIGAGVGATAGWVTPEGAETLASNAIHKEKQVSSRALNSIGMGSNVASGSSASPTASASDVKWAQAELQREGLYRGPIDGIMGPDTQQALAHYQAREGLQQTATLDLTSIDHLTNSIRTAQTTNVEDTGSGSSTPPQPPQDQDAAK